MRLIGGNPAPRIETLEELPGKVNYFIGSDPERWRADIPTYAKIAYREVYPGVDLIYYGNQRLLEYDFVVAPGAATTPTPTVPTSTPTVTLSPTTTPTATVPTSTPTFTPSPSITPAPSVPTSTPTVTLSPTVTPTGTVPTSSPTSTPSPSITPTPNAPTTTPTITLSPTTTPTGTVRTSTATPTPTRTLTTPTATASATRTRTPTATVAPNQCPSGQGFWKEHPEAWPATVLSLGSQSYGRDELLSILNAPSEEDATLILARQLIAAKLNILRGSNPGPISGTVAFADDLLRSFAGRLPYTVDPASPMGQTMVQTAGFLQRYNEGVLTPNCVAVPTSTPAVETPTATSTPTPTPTPTSTPGVGPVGRSLSLTYLGARQIALSWRPGRGTPVVLRIGPGAVAPVRPSSGTSHVESLEPGASLACYVVAALEGSRAAVSDLLCVLPGSAAGLAAENFALRLDESPTAVLSWDRARGATGYILLPVGTERLQILPASATRATDQTAGGLTCYVLVAQIGTTTSGTTAVLCAIPGFATDFGAGSVPARSTSPGFPPAVLTPIPR